MKNDLVSHMRLARKERGVSQSALASALGVSQPMIAEIESGTKKLPAELYPIIRRWILTGKLPTQTELGARTNTREGK